MYESTHHRAGNTWAKFKVDRLPNTKKLNV